MSSQQHFIDTLNNNRAMCIEALRIYLGIGLIAKGLQFMLDPTIIQSYIESSQLPFFDYLSVHLIFLVHIVGGFFLAIGLLTRFSAIVQTPLLLGAVFFVHIKEGLFTKAQNLEFVILVLFLLLMFAVYGGGKLSVDFYLQKRRKEQSI